MRRVLSAIALAAVLAVTAAAGGAGARTVVPSLRLVDQSPLAVHGAGFQARERVRVSFFTAGAVVRHTTADARGAFTVSSDKAIASRCEGFRIVAVGNRGSRAEVKHIPLPACNPG